MLSFEISSEEVYPQNSSTLSKVMTSFNKSAQLSLGPVDVGVLVNHNVHVFIRGCLTLKFLGSWKTVTGSLMTMIAGLLDGDVDVEGAVVE